MIASEFAFLALGLVLGVASGSALVMVLGSRPPAREVRLTVGLDAVPRRAATLSSDAFITSPAEPARGGPADRRSLDRDEAPVEPARPSLIPAMAIAASGPGTGVFMRTPVHSGATATYAVGIPIVPERDPVLDAIRVQAAAAAERLYGAARPAATALLERQLATTDAADAANAAERAPVLEPREDDSSLDPDVADETPALLRILRGDSRALFATAAVLAGADEADRRAWQTAIMSLTGAVVDRAIGSGWLDFPVGNPFWDTLTTDQCREIAAALAATGHRFDGVDGWEDDRAPNHRDLTIAVAAAGLEPRRIRAWPTQDEIGSLYLEVTAAADDFLAAHAPNLDLEEAQALAGVGEEDLARLWAAWDRVRSVLMAPVVSA
jgi:hypothetical protein